ncbi:hypothetical protein KR51_00035500 [Rubidibacter lacunae KORDI 51-2]|uniref:Uncharacterized protein n=1 Tax=Rubidibacter lacunae KORDI 51-2 TaxID=582515 RepID=U5DJT8_9CHRO|nr:hypothetical protein [Rubidibacter lacunae]ERN39950.1 hypothetical protein KR51_00035500 [Rubidibacter lacunae KORDI 51-2]
MAAHLTGCRGRLRHRPSLGALPAASETEGPATAPSTAESSAAWGFKKNLGADLSLLGAHRLGQKPLKGRIRYITEDEGRFGLKTTTGRRITLSGVKPLGEWESKEYQRWLGAYRIE